MPDREYVSPISITFVQADNLMRLDRWSRELRQIGEMSVMKDFFEPAIIKLIESEMATVRAHKGASDSEATIEANGMLDVLSPTLRAIELAEKEIERQREGFS